MLFTHMDQLGLIVRKIEDDGFLKFERVGGVPEKFCQDKLFQQSQKTANHFPVLLE